MAEYTAIPTGSPWESSYYNMFSDSSSKPYRELKDYCTWYDTYHGMTENGRTAATTDRTRWACPSVPTIPYRASTAFFRFLNTPQQLNELPSFHLSSSDHHSTTAPPVKKIPPKAVNVSGTFEIAPVLNNNSDDKQTRIDEIEKQRQDEENFVATKSPNTLLPLMNYEYNLREIMKNCILLEDHLIHPEKRCGDCCVKHFLFLEALAEEARTLDKSNDMDPSLKKLPAFFRDCSQQWYRTVQNPGATDNDYNQVAQRLRNLRKQYQQTYFPILWTDETNTASSSCTNGLCPNTTATK